MRNIEFTNKGWDDFVEWSQNDHSWCGFAIRTPAKRPEKTYR